MVPAKRELILKMTHFWDVVLCGQMLTASSLMIAVMLEAVRSSDMLVNFYQSTQLFRFPEDGYLHICYCENPTSERAKLKSLVQ
jgi:hypothetical protein